MDRRGCVAAGPWQAPHKPSLSESRGGRLNTTAKSLAGATRREAGLLVCKWPERAPVIVLVSVYLHLKTETLHNLLSDTIIQFCPSVHTFHSMSINGGLFMWC